MPLPRSLLRMTPEELDAFLSSERTVRLATVSADGQPHVVPLWYVWLDGAMYLYSLRRSRRARHLASGSRVAACVDAGAAYGELRGAVLYGTVEDATDDPALERVRRAFGEKYLGFEVPDRPSHQWLRLRPAQVASWDFRKIPEGADRMGRAR